MDAANVDLKGFTDAFYQRLCSARLQPVLDTLVYLKHETDVWFEITTLLIPGENDSDEELDAMTRWIAETLGPEVPIHFSAFHPDWKMLDTPPTPPSTLTRATAIAAANGLRHAYTGNVHDLEGDATRLPRLRRPLRRGVRRPRRILGSAAAAGAAGAAARSGVAPAKLGCVSLALRLNRKLVGRRRGTQP